MNKDKLIKDLLKDPTVAFNKFYIAIVICSWLIIDLGILFLDLNLGLKLIIFGIFNLLFTIIMVSTR